MVLLAACLFVPLRAHAHDLPFSYVNLELGGQRLSGTIVVHSFDLGHDLGVPPEQLLEPHIATREQDAIVKLLAPRLSVRVNGSFVFPRWDRMTVDAPRQMLTLSVIYPISQPVEDIQFLGVLFPYDPNHQTFVNLHEQGLVTQGILTAASPSFTWRSGNTQTALAVVRRFLPEGIHHILIGPDHLLFLAGLLLRGGRARRLALIVSAFTVAHSITLTLAALGLVHLPGRLIESAIALSILYVGLDTLLRPNGSDQRVALAFGFGLVHGFGFANVLREMALPRHALGWSLFAFNAGVEIGQLMVVGTVFFLFAAIRRQGSLAQRYLVTAGSICVTCAGAIWFVQRAFLPMR